MRVLLCIFFILLLGCKQQQKEEPQKVTTPSTDKEVIREADPQFDYSPIYGIYDHESRTSGFNAVVVLRQNGLNLYFNVSVLQGNCKSEAEGSIIMVDHLKNYYTGFYNSENCPMQFSFYPEEGKIRIKEVTLCTVHDPGCNFEGTYVKRKSEN